jgi:protein arginine kinase activator
MLCEKCNKNEATYFYHENVNGEERSYKLCQSCMEEMKKSGELTRSHDFTSFFDDSTFLDPIKSFGSLFESLFAPTQMLTRGEAKCLGCGSTIPDIAKSGKAGCPECYNTFRREFSGIAGRIHGRREHTGRAPRKTSEKNEMKKRIAELEAEQTQAVKNENYERAAEIRDELKRLREGL